MTRLILLAFLVGYTVRSICGEIQYPVSYDLGLKNAQPIAGFITGGAIFGPEGIPVIEGTNASTTILEYVNLDRIASMTLTGSDTISFVVSLKTGESFTARASVPNDPIIILRDEIASGGKIDLGKERIFNRNNFRGISAIEFEADIPPEERIGLMKDLARQLVTALEAEELEKAADLNYQLGQMFESLQAPDEKEVEGSPKTRN